MPLPERRGFYWGASGDVGLGILSDYNRAYGARVDGGFAFGAQGRIGYFFNSIVGLYVEPRLSLAVNPDYGAYTFNTSVLALAHQGTQQFEAAQSKPVGKLVNMAGRQRMLSQRMAMYYLAARLPIDAPAAVAEITKARGDFVNAMAFLRLAPETTPQIQEQLQLADGQWVFFDAALRRSGSSDAGSARALGEIFMASENLLSVMDRVTGLYSALKA